jgi:hypothetical protein
MSSALLSNASRSSVSIAVRQSSQALRAPPWTGYDQRGRRLPQKSQRTNTCSHRCQAPG